MSRARFSHLRSIVGLVSGFSFVLILGSCGPAPQTATGGAPDVSDPGKNKPVPTDFSGDPASFAGQWSGACSYVKNSARYTNCTAVLTIKQDSMSSYLMGSLQYTIGYTTPAPFTIHRIDIDGNNLTSNGRSIGKIGKGAFQFYDDTVGELSAKVFANGSLGLNLLQLPGNEAVTCTAGYCFSAALTRSGL